ncbi:MAG: alginate lyase family protein [Alphaproteobacteria bacterium]|nr:alginate lyase family protein [Alphaproteobacteria bacterium]
MRLGFRNAARAGCWRYFACCLVVLALAGAGRALADQCPTFAPVMYLELVGIYTDPAQSVVDHQAEQKNTEVTRSVDDFMRYVETAVDGSSGKSDAAMLACAFSAYRSWAVAGALTGEPPKYNRDGAAKRAQYIVGLNILALKFKAAGAPADGQILAWLRALNHKNMDAYLRGTNRGNLYAWSGAAAAVFALLDHDRKALDYQDQVWRQTIAAIRDDGTIDGEMVRGRRALIYHMFSFSATLVLQEARRALRYRDEPSDVARVKLLADQIGRSLCDPRFLEERARAAQEVPGDWAYRIPIGFGKNVLGENWTRCGRPNSDLSDPTLGGNAHESAAVMRKLVR